LSYRGTNLSAHWKIPIMAIQTALSSYLCGT